MLLPPSYTPKPLRPIDRTKPRPLTYGIGTPKLHQEPDVETPVLRVEMRFGPIADLEKCLDQVALENDILVRFNPNHTDDIIWVFRENAWHPQPEVSHTDYFQLFEFVDA